MYRKKKEENHDNEYLTTRSYEPKLYYPLLLLCSVTSSSYISHAAPFPSHLLKTPISSIFKKGMKGIK